MGKLVYFLVYVFFFENFIFAVYVFYLNTKKLALIIFLPYLSNTLSDKFSNRLLDQKIQF